MALDKEVLESEEFKAAVEEALKAEYPGLVANKDKLLEQKRDLQAIVDTYEGLDVKEAKRAVAAIRKAEEEAARKAGNFDTLKAQLEKEHATQIEQLANERDSYKSSLEHEMIEKAAIEGITEAKGFPKVLKPHVIDKMQLRQMEDGKFRAVVLDENGQPRLKKGASNASDFMPIKEFVESLKADDEFAHAFQGAGASGGATPPRVEHGGKVKQATEGYRIL